MLKFKDRFLLSSAAFALFGCFVWLFNSLLFAGYTVAFWLPLAVGAVVIFACGLASDKPKRIISAAILIFTLAFMLIFRVRIADGLAALFNAFIDAYKQVRPRNYDVFTVSRPQNFICIFVPIAALTSLAFGRAIERHSRIFCALATVLVVVVAAVFLPILTSAQISVSALVCLLLWIFALTEYKQGGELSANTVFCGAWLRATVIILLSVALLSGVFGGEKPKFIIKSTSRIVRAADDLRYGKTEGSGLTEGDLALADGRKSGGETLLNVTMSSPSSCYLRGFVGETYKDSRWASLPNDVLYKNADSFAFLHQNGFYAQAQLAAASYTVSKKKQKNENIIQVENIGLPSKYIYAPYGLSEQSDLLDMKAVGDSTVYADGIHGRRSYSLTEDNSLVLKYQKNAALILKNADNAAVREYLGREAVYNNFVYEQYTSLPSDIDAYLSEKLGGFTKQDGERHFDYSSAKQNILYYLTETLTYDETVSGTQEGVDFVLNFLDGTKRGYDVHYASAAVMMFRYYGIPSRFAEGYVVTNKEAAKAKSGEALALDNTHAHAWAEYYQDGIGWLPFEATPTYLSVMDQPDTYRDVSGLIGQTHENEHKQALQPEEPDADEKPTLLSFWLKNRLTIMLIVSVAAAVVLLLLFILWILRELRKSAARKALFLSKDLRLAVCTAVGYIADIMAADGITIDKRAAEDYAELLDEDLRERYLTAVTVWQKAMFSAESPTREERDLVISLKDEMYLRLWEKSGVLKKIQIKFMYFL